ncbi:MAG: ABC transporter substrate-binding protein, partial [Anaerolineales bacterium]|nr:ABC transporter substrate-binding protein [Anaerolineales bacterium]
MKQTRLLPLLSLLLAALLVLAACGGNATPEPAPEPEPTAVPAEPEEETPAEEEAPEEEAPTAEEEGEEEPMAEEPMGDLTCAEPIKVGLITDETGSLAIYGAHVLRGFPLGMEYATGSEGVVGDDFTSYTLDGCEFQVYTRDDQSNPENTATVARELIEIEGVDILVGTVSSGATASLQELAAQNDVVLIVAPAAANDITGVSFNEYTFRTSRNNYQD